MKLNSVAFTKLSFLSNDLKAGPWALGYEMKSDVAMELAIHDPDYR